MIQKIFTFGLALAGSLMLPLQASAENKVAVHGSVQADVVFPEVDDDIKTGTYDHKILFNTYADVNLASKYVDAGLRAEFMKWPLPGYDDDFAGWGLSHVYVKGKYKGFELTAGDFYEQFGSGFILRTYEERSLGVDNAIRGGRLNITALPGVRLTLLGGLQRTYWDWSKHSQVYGANAEIYMEQWMPSLRDRNATWMIGGSWVLKHERDEDIIIDGTNDRLNLPKAVDAFDVRSSLNLNGWNLLAEFAWKGQDPSFNNQYTYGTGHAEMISASYSRKGMSALVQVKRSDNMSYRSQRSRSDLAGFINNMPAFAYQHTYALAALYPYATQVAQGEWAFQGQFSYNFKKGSPLGGRYGTKFIINGSYISSLDKGPNPQGLNGSIFGTDGAKASYFKMGSANYFDVNIQMEKKFTSKLQGTFMYMNQFFNNRTLTIWEPLEKKPDQKMEKYIHSNIIVGDLKYKFNRKFTLRGELQYLFSDDADKDWAYGLLELSYNPYLMITVSDLWNTGTTGLHYYMFGITGNYKSNRLMLSYGRTRKGFNCSGGVCRVVPAMHGFQISYSYNF